MSAGAITGVAGVFITGYPFMTDHAEAFDGCAIYSLIVFGLLVLS